VVDLGAHVLLSAVDCIGDDLHVDHAARGKAESNVKDTEVGDSVGSLGLDVMTTEVRVMPLKLCPLVGGRPKPNGEVHMVVKMVESEDEPRRRIAPQAARATTRYPL